jgi:hypothetical protein
MEDYKDNYGETHFYNKYSKFLNIDPATYYPDQYSRNLKNSFTKGGQTKKRSKKSKKSKKSKSRKHKKNSKRKL